MGVLLCSTSIVPADPSSISGLHVASQRTNQRAAARKLRKLAVADELVNACGTRLPYGAPGV